jgi:U3 small nucleolar RNA-associated protein 10
MSTSLAEQLRRLQTPQSSQFVDTRKRDSILFTQKEAATKSRETIYEIGLSGLQELIEINSAFAEFESTLFDYTSKDVQRAVETKDINILLNKNIKRFLFQLSPYFLIPSTHKCLEWLIRRFNINLYNKEEFLMLILPYHQTNMFVRCVQTMKFDDPADKWYFLADVKKSSSPLSKYAIWNHGASFPAFLEFVGKFTYEAIKEFGQRSGTLQTMISFYLTTVVGTLEQAPVVNENIILAVVKYLIKTYKSNVIDYTAAGYMITAHLLTKTKLIVKVLSEIMDRILSNVHPQLSQNVFLIFVLMFQTQSNELEINNAALEKLMEFKWCLKALDQIQNQGKSTINFQKALIKAIMKKIQNKDDKYQKVKEFCENLFQEIVFNDEDAGIIIK